MEEKIDDDPRRHGRHMDGMAPVVMTQEDSVASAARSALSVDDDQAWETRPLSEP